MDDLWLLLVVVVPALVAHFLLKLRERQRTQFQAATLANGLECPTCQTKRLRWTGLKSEGQSSHDEWIILNEYECQSCRQRFTFSDRRELRTGLDDFG